MVGRRCSDPAHGYFLPLLDYFLYEAELAAPLHGGASPTPDPPSSPLVSNKHKCGIKVHAAPHSEAARAHLVCFVLSVKSGHFSIL